MYKEYNMSKYVNEYGIMVDESTKDLSTKIENLVRDHIQTVYKDGGSIVNSILIINYIQAGVDCVLAEQQIKESLRLKKLIEDKKSINWNEIPNV